jgi:hypothetical protein
VFDDSELDSRSPVLSHQTRKIRVTTAKKERIMSTPQVSTGAYSARHTRQRVAPLTIPVLRLRQALSEAAEHAAIATSGYAIAVLIERNRGASQGAIHAIRDLYADELAQETEALADRWCADLGAGQSETVCPVAWAIQEVVEWIDSSARYHGLGEVQQSVPLTWAPEGMGSEPLCLTEVVEQRLRLLKRELLEHGVITTDPGAAPGPSSFPAAKRHSVEEVAR